ncbi:MAG: hypothetical protein Alpg2KO_09540 [Alphaproteobacteria bacterium]
MARFVTSTAFVEAFLLAQFPFPADEYDQTDGIYQSVTLDYLSIINGPAVGSITFTGAIQIEDQGAFASGTLTRVDLNGANDSFSITDIGGLSMAEIGATPGFTDVLAHVFSGNDTIRLSGEDDTIKTYGGIDDIRAGAGNDVVEAMGGSDMIEGQGGDDALFGGKGRDTINGGKGNDGVNGGEGNDTLTGGSGGDDLDGGDGKDKLLGNTGTDELFGGAGNDTLNGGRGDDSLTGGTGRDKMKGSKGTDSFIFTSRDDSGTGSDADRISDFASDEILDINLLQLVGQTVETFTFVGGNAFSGQSGEMRFADERFAIDFDGDSQADFEVRLVGVQTFTEDNLDFI